MTEQFAVAMVALIPVLTLVTRVDYQAHASRWVDMASLGYGVNGAERKFMLVTRYLAILQLLDLAYLVWWLAATTRPEHPVMAWVVAGTVVAQFSVISQYTISLPGAIERLAKERRQR
ncbi:hypothetical protein ACWCQZ_45275 [Streptomyces sp. NPDC002285]